MKLKLRRVFSSIFSGAARLHFSQYGEDVYLNKKFRSSKLDFYYIDIGAHHPFHLSNTNVLWVKGWNGVNVDASSKTIKEFNRKKNKDINLNAAIATEDFCLHNKHIEFFSSKEIDNCATCDPFIAKERGLNNVIKVPCTSLPSIIAEAERRFDSKFGFLNIDIEGFDEKIIEDIEKWPSLPEVLMIEIYSEDIEELLQKKSYKTIKEIGYSLVQKTGHTCIFEKKKSSNI